MNRARHPVHKCVRDHWYGFDFLGMFTVEAEPAFTGYYFWALQGMILASGDKPTVLTFTEKEIVLS